MIYRPTTKKHRSTIKLHEPYHGEPHYSVKYFIMALLVTVCIFVVGLLIILNKI